MTEPQSTGEAAKSNSYAGLLRLGPVAKKEGVREFRIVLEESQRLSKLDVRVLSGQVLVKGVVLITEADVRVEVQNLRGISLSEVGKIYSSENLSLNEGVKEILLSAEALTESGELLISAISDIKVPKISLWQPTLNTTPNYVRGGGGASGWTPRVRNTDECANGFCTGDIVFYMRYRAVIDKIYPDGKVTILQRGVRRTLASTSELVPMSASPDRR